ncbi:transcriptional regulator [Oceaniferula spumae]|uniref:Transcriptional regulator n=1 Tax=Oceaniferula spumae TaxID=2979115 RepID=A0AAT9FKU6_9BACT
MDFFYDISDMRKPYECPSSMKKTLQDQKQWLDSIASEASFEQLFDHIPGISFFAKNAQGVLMRGNKNYLARFNLSSEADLIGLSDYDLMPSTLADHFKKDDEEVINNGQPKLHIIELFFNRQGLPDWYITNKLPLFSNKGKVIGLMGIIRSHAGTHDHNQSYARIAPAMEYLRLHFRDKITISDLAKTAGLSLRQFGRCFAETYGISPQRFLIKTRVQAACELLRDSNEDLATIALSLGFYDQSSFTLQFRKHMGLTPRRYRSQAQAG